MKKLASILSMTAMFIAMMASVAFAADDTTAAIDTGDTAWVLIQCSTCIYHDTRSCIFLWWYGKK